MPGFTPADGDLLQIRVVCYTPTQIAMNVLHYQQFSHTGIGLTLQEISSEYMSRVRNAYRVIMSPETKFRGVGVANLMNPATIEYVDVSGDAVGLTGVDTLPTQTSLLISLKTPLRGRRYIGHIYPGFPSSAYQLAGGGMNPAGLAANQALAAAVVSAAPLTVGGNSATLYLAVRHPDVIVAGVHIPQWTTVNVVAAAPLFATQRRRGQFGRENLPPF